MNFIMFSLSTIKTLSNDKKRFFKNFASLSIMQIAGYILPLLTLPYLARVLDAEKFGLVFFAQAFIQYFMILTDFGFNLSATKEISVNRENPDKVAEIFNSVMLIRFVLLLVSLLILVIVVFGFSKFRNDWAVYFLTFGMAVGNVLFPIWFFQGMERMKFVTILNILSRVIFTVLIFVFIKKSSDFIYVPLLNSIGFLASGILSLWIVYKYFDVKFFVPDLKTIIVHLKDSTQFFLSRVSVSLYTSSNAFVLGLFTSNQAVGYYVAAEKLYQALQYIYFPINSSLYPYMSKEKNIRFFKKLFGGAFILNIVLSLLIFIFAKEIIHIFYGADLVKSTGVLQIFSMAALLLIPSIFLGYPFLAALGQSKYANNSVIIGSVIHILGLGTLILFSALNIYTVAIMVIFTEGTVLAIRIYGIKRHKLWNISNKLEESKPVS